MKMEMPQKDDKPDYTAYMSMAYSQSDHSCCYCGNPIENIGQEEKIAEPPWKEGFPSRRFGGNLCHKNCEVFTPTENMKTEERGDLVMRVVGESIVHGIHYDVYENGDMVPHGEKPKKEILPKIEDVMTIPDELSHPDIKIPSTKVITKEGTPAMIEDRSENSPISFYDLYIAFVEDEYSKQLGTNTSESHGPFLDVHNLEQIEELLVLHNVNPTEAYRNFIYKFDNAIKGKGNASN